MNMNTVKQATRTADEAVLQMADGYERDWWFCGGRWRQDAKGVMSPPANLVDDNLAIDQRHAYGDFEARFEFRWDVHWTTAGFIFRAQNAHGYYLVEFPVSAQQSVSEQFWAVIARVDEHGWRQVLHMQMVYGVSSTPHIWHAVRLRVRGEEICLWVDGRPIDAVRDANYRAGRIGLLSNSGLGETPKSSFRNVRVAGRPVEAAVWNAAIKPAPKWSVVDAEKGWFCRNIVRTDSGELVFCGQAIKMSSDPNALLMIDKLVRSADNGRTWIAYEPAQPTSPINYMTVQLRRLPDGSLERYGHTSGLPSKIAKASSQDYGRTWSQWREVAEIASPSHTKFAELNPCVMLETRDESLLWFGYFARAWSSRVVEGRTHFCDPSPWTQTYCIKSTDGGETWSEPVNLDGLGVDPSLMPPGSEAHAKDEMNEVSAVQVRDGRILALIRPMRSPCMWESWSDDDGRTWTPAMRGPFPMWGCMYAMLTTASGAILVGGRFPGMAVQVSHDSGMTWRCYEVDTCLWANGTMYEIEPDVVLFIYGGWDTMPQVRYQILRVTRDGLQRVPAEPFCFAVHPAVVSLTPLDGDWRFKPDPDNVGVPQAWFAPDHDDDRWALIQTDRSWTQQGFADYYGSAWYRLAVTVPNDLRPSKHLWLLFGAVDKEATVYLDGRELFAHTATATGQPVEQLWNQPFKVDVRSLMKPGSKHVIAVHARSESGGAGMWRPACLASASDDLSPEQLLSAFRNHMAQ